MPSCLLLFVACFLPLESAEQREDGVEDFLEIHALQSLDKIKKPAERRGDQAQNVVDVHVPAPFEI